MECGVCIAMIGIILPSTWLVIAAKSAAEFPHNQTQTEGKLSLLVLKASVPLQSTTFPLPHLSLLSAPLNLPWLESSVFKLKLSCPSDRDTQCSSPDSVLFYHFHIFCLQPSQPESHDMAAHVQIQLASAALLTEGLHVTVKCFRLEPSCDPPHSSMNLPLKGVVSLLFESLRIKVTASWLDSGRTLVDWSCVPDMIL